MLPEIAIPAVLPVEALSLSSITLLRKCPTKWKHRYVDRVYEPPSGAMILGSAFGAAEATNFQLKIESGVDLAVDDVLDQFSDEWRERVDREEIAWGAEKPGDLKDAGARALTAYHAEIAPAVRPVAVEREFRLRFDGAAWTFTGYLDLEEASGAVGDLKMRGRRLTQVDADADPQPASYLLARREEARAGHGHPPAGFDFHVAVRTRTPVVEIVRTDRSDQQLDAFLGRILAAAAEIDWRTTYDVWDGAPRDAWWCAARSCGYWASCPLGGAGRVVREVSFA